MVAGIINLDLRFREKTLSSYRWARNAGPGAKMGRGTWRGGTTRSGTWPSWLFWQISTTGRSCQSQGTLPIALERCMSLTEGFTRWVPLAFDKSPDSWLVSKVLIVDLVSGSQSAAGYLGSEVFQIICWLRSVDLLINQLILETPVDSWPPCFPFMRKNAIIIFPHKIHILSSYSHKT